MHPVGAYGGRQPRVVVYYQPGPMGMRRPYRFFSQLQPVAQAAGFLAQLYEAGPGRSRR